MDDDPAKIALAMRIARRTLRIVYQNIVFALAIKFACLVLGAIGMASMWTAIFADVGVMVLAVLNAPVPCTPRIWRKRMNSKNSAGQPENCPALFLYMRCIQAFYFMHKLRFFFDIKFSGKHAGRCFQLFQISVFPDPRIASVPIDGTGTGITQP